MSCHSFEYCTLYKMLYKKVFPLAFFIVGIGVFVFWVAPILESIEPVRKIQEHTIKYNIDASALYYTDSEEFNGADIRMKDSIQKP